MTPPVMFHLDNGRLKADRLLSILLRLDTERRVTAGELAAALEVSPRIILRDLEALSASGVPVVSERGSGGGWFLLELYRTKLSGLSVSEAQSLSLSLPAELRRPLGLAQQGATGRAKLHAALPTQIRAQVDWLRSRLLVDTPDWQQDLDSGPHLAALQEALRQGKHIRFNYRRMTGEAGERRLDPYRLVLRKGRWYLIGAAADSVRTYRVDRTEELSLLEQDSTRPADFDLLDHWNQSRQELLRALPRHLVTLLLHEPDLPELTFGVRFCTVDHQEPAPDWAADGWRVRLAFDTRGVALAFVLGLGARVVVEEPVEVREAVSQQTRQLVALYDTGAGEQHQ